MQSQQLNLAHQAYSLSHIYDENKKLQSHIHKITVNYEQLLQENQNLNKILSNKETQFVQNKLKQENLQHCFDNLKKQYEILQGDYQSLYNLMNSNKKFELREFYKNQHHFMEDLMKIQKQSYREGKKKQDQNINKYRQQLSRLVKENEQLKLSILESTSKYNQRIYQLQLQNVENQTRLKSIKKYEIEQTSIKQNYNDSENKIFNLEIKIENLNEKLRIQEQINENLIKQNQETFNKYKKLQDKSKNNQTIQKNVYQKILEQPSLDYIADLVKENGKLRTQIELITDKYVNLSIKYPDLVENQNSISQLLKYNLKVQKVKQFEQQNSELKKKLEITSRNYEDLEKKHIALIKKGEQQSNKFSTLLKRFNQIFIRINPYFDIYKYQDLEMDEELENYFDLRKDYKPQKQLQKDNSRLNSELRQKQFLFNKKKRQDEETINELTNSLNAQAKQNLKFTQELDKLTLINIKLKEQINQLQQVHINQQSLTAPVSYKRRQLQNKVNIPLMNSYIEQIQNQRSDLLQIITEKDQQNYKLKSELRQLSINQNIQIIKITQQKLTELPVRLTVDTILAESSEKCNAQEISQKLDDIRQQIQNQYNIYQLDVKKYEAEYIEQFKQITNNLNKWKNQYEILQFSKLAEETKQTVIKKVNADKMDIQLNDSINSRGVLENDNQILNDNILRQPSLNNFDNISISHQDNNNRAVGQSTVQNLTQTLKKYQQEMNEVLAMCSKLSTEYFELKNKLQNYETMEKSNSELIKKSSLISQQLQQTRSILNSKQQMIINLTLLYKGKEKQSIELGERLRHQTGHIQTELREQKKRNQAMLKEFGQLKDKVYELSSHQVSGSEPLGRSQFETIVVMHQNKNKQLQLLVQRNKLLEIKIERLITELKDSRKNEISPLQQQQIHQLNDLLKQSNILQLIKKANDMIQKQ